MGSNILQICSSSHCVRALAPCLTVGCCVVNGLVPRTLLMEFPLFSEVSAILFLRRYLSRYHLCLLLGFGEPYNCAVVCTINLPQNNTNFLIKRPISAVSSYYNNIAIPSIFVNTSILQTMSKPPPFHLFPLVYYPSLILWYWYKIWASK